MTDEQVTCADCGAPIEHVVGTGPHQWGERTTKPVTQPNGWGPAGAANVIGWDLCCRVVYDPTNTGRVLAADFHHVDGEDQRHFRAGA